MATIRLPYTRVETSKENSQAALTPKDFARWNSSLLGLGNITEDASTKDCVAAIVDLEGFTVFSKQIDPQLVVPAFLQSFLQWLFAAVAEEFTHSKQDGKVLLWGNLPFFAKFLGDGVMFLWDTAGLHATGIGNIAVAIGDVCSKYPEQFYAKHVDGFSELPRRLRVGVARGQILSVGGGLDYVGPCINMAARLQKLASLPFAVSQRGFPLESFGEKRRTTLAVKRTRIRGIGDDELVLVRHADFEQLSAEERALFR